MTAIPAALESEPHRSIADCLEWGSWPIPENTTIAWGARAIYRLTTIDTPTKRLRGRVVQRARSTTEAEIDIPFDRQSMLGGSDIEHKAFGVWLNKTALPALRKWCIKQYVTADSDEVFELASDGFAIKAGPRASYGYLYIRAWKDGAA